MPIEARALHAQDPGAFVLPYRRQCVLVQAELVAALGMQAQHPDWARRVALRLAQRRT